MEEITVTASRQNGESIPAKFSIGQTLDELSQQFGAEIVYSHVRRSLIIALQAFMRTQLDAQKSPEDIQVAVAAWKPGVRRAAKTPLERAMEEVARMSPADRAALAKKIRSQGKEDTAVAA